MNRQTKGLKLSSTQRDQLVSQFQGITSSSQQDAVKYLKKYSYNINSAIDAYLSTTATQAERTRETSANKLAQLFNRYKDTDSDMIGIDGTIRFCQDLGVEPEDVVLLAIAHDLKSPGVGQWKSEGWVEGLQSWNCDSLESIKRALPGKRQQLLTNPEYFRAVYLSTFNFAKPPDQRNLPTDSAVDYQRLLIPSALGPGGALSSSSPPGFNADHFEWWVEYLSESNVKAVTKDVWNNLIDFIRQIDARFETHDVEAAWPSVIDDFVEYAKKRAAFTMDES